VLGFVGNLLNTKIVTDVIMLKELWKEITIAISVPILAGFIGFAILGQICFDNLPYLLCN
jgi:hypothetical protein